MEQNDRDGRETDTFNWAESGIADLTVKATRIGCKPEANRATTPS